jgi:hypothetical protein
MVIGKDEYYDERTDSDELARNEKSFFISECRRLNQPSSHFHRSSEEAPDSPKGPAQSSPSARHKCEAKGLA